MKLASAASLVFAFLATLYTHAAPSPAQEKFAETGTAGDAILAEGKGFEIRRSELAQILATAKAKNPKDEISKDDEARALSQLIEIRLVLLGATAAEKVEGEKFAATRLAYIAKTLGQSELERRLTSTCMTANDLLLKLAQEQTAQSSLARQLRIQVSDLEARKYFDTHPGVFDLPPLAHIRELLLLTTEGSSSNPLPQAVVEAKHKQIVDLFKRVRAGEDFAELAKQYNEDPISKDKDGDLSFRKSQMEFGDLAFSMKPTEISDVLTNEDGYRLFQLIEIIPAKKVEYNSVEDRIKNALIGEEKRKLAPAYISQLRKAANVQVLDVSLKVSEAPAAQGAGTDTESVSETTPAAKVE